MLVKLYFTSYSYQYWSNLLSDIGVRWWFLKHLYSATIGIFVMGSRLCPHQKNTWLRMIYCYKSFGGKIGNSSRGCGVLPFHIGRTWFKVAVTSSNQFLPVVAYDK